VTSKTEGKVDNSHMLVKYDARLRDNVAVNVVQEVTDTVQVRCKSLWCGCVQVACWGGGVAREAQLVVALELVLRWPCAASCAFAPLCLANAPVCFCLPTVWSMLWVLFHLCRLLRQVHTSQLEQSQQALARCGK
jgi:hypothetical protein